VRVALGGGEEAGVFVAREVFSGAVLEQFTRFRVERGGLGGHWWVGFALKGQVPVGGGGGVAGVPPRAYALCSMTSKEDARPLGVIEACPHLSPGYAPLIFGVSAQKVQRHTPHYSEVCRTIIFSASIVIFTELYICNCLGPERPPLRDAG